MKTLTVVVPCYNEENSLNNYYYQTKEILKSIPDLEYKFAY